MTGSAGRWEWRTFGPGARVAEHGWRHLAPVGTQESDEVYLLSGAGETVKVRAELMDIKQLLATDVFGLQQWTPVLKASSRSIVRTWSACSRHSTCRSPS